MSAKQICQYCSRVLTAGTAHEFDGVIMCEDCLDERTFVCDRCGERVWGDDAVTDEDYTLCQSCYDDYYTRCEECNAIISNDDVCYDDDDVPYCERCYDRCCCGTIHEYSYKPEPIFYGAGNRFFGVELEIDGAGKDGYNAEKILDAANYGDERIYIKSDGSLDSGMEIVTHPMSLDYHMTEMPWPEVSERALDMRYRSHNTGTCGLHIHVNRTTFGEEREVQDECISRILYFVEHHWEELLKFSRRTESQMNRWAARYGYKNSPKEVMENAKKHCIGRYACVNITNYQTIEFRMFKGTLKVNTILATLQIVDMLCDMAVNMSDTEISKLSWTDFVIQIPTNKYPELIMYLKERRLYVNEPVEMNANEEM